MTRLVLAALAVTLLCACDPAYEPPCRVERRSRPIEDPAIGTRANVALARTDDGVVASWVKVDVPDGGVDPSPTLGGFEVVDLDVRGPGVSVAGRESIASPPELRARKGSLESAGVARERGATLVHWVESVTSTEPEGRVRTAFAAKLAYAGGAPVVAPAEAACERCVMTVAFTAFADESIAIVRIAPDAALPGVLGAPVAPVFRALRVRRDGSVSAVPLPLAPRPAPFAGSTPAVLAVERDDAGRLVIASGGRAWLVDRVRLTVEAGPVDLPAGDARVRWSRDASSAGTAPFTLAWTISPAEDGRSSDTFARREVFVTGPAFAERSRVSHGRTVLGLDRSGDDVGLLFESAGRLFFASTSPSGRKHGGDVLVDRIAESRGTFGEFTSEDAIGVFASGAGRFTTVTLGRGVLETAEIVCAP